MGTPKEALGRLGIGFGKLPIEERLVLRPLLLYAYIGSSGKPYPQICRELNLPQDEPNEVVRKQVEEFCRKQLGL
ncbi:hypothetical protein KKD19_05475 [Patescibacteria group bacterium]|nr:hypothetical protein [Patescibacteria group bacterium]MBU4512655.1 hypothetical protein [Patescibacteria group bacterium]MCG2693561.1 hypothetical protein [Candidatus Parcubacteria bacterium]